MDEASARGVVLVRAFEQASGPLWSADDAAWATRLAAETAPKNADAERFLAERAHHALQRLVPRERRAEHWLAHSGWRWPLVPLAVLVGGALGLTANVLGRQAIVDVLAPPAWAVIAWNLVVYLLLLVGLMRPASAGGLVRRGLAAWWRRSVGTGPLREATMQWATLSAPQTLSRAALVLHLAAAAVAGGLIAGLYLRGLVFDFRAGWQSTFLDAETVQRTLALLLAPATAFTGIAVPDIPGIEALRLTPASSAPTASAAPWIHLYAAMLVLFVVLPRLVLATLAMARAAWQSGHVALPLDDPYVQALLRGRAGAVASVRICPHAAAPGAAAALSLRARLAQEFGDRVQVQLAEPTHLGDEEGAGARVRHGESAGAAPGLLIALVDLSATPEDESHGRFIAALRQGAPGVPLRLLADESGFKRRFGGLPGRVDERRAAWRAFAQAQGVDFDAADLDATA